ncbi:MAG: hypothetical protein LBU06_06280 [Desulfovibrio sp.]|nr:hypothetical protein [Desulfovibrio sp.]
MTKSSIAQYETAMNAEEKIMTHRLYAGIYYYGRLFRQAQGPGGGAR